VAQGFRVYKTLYPPIETSILKASNVFFWFFFLVIMGQLNWLIAQEQKKLGKHPPSNGLKYQYTTIESMLSTKETT
jgi:hypothetical protein